jgi:hypothetical protein
MADMPYIPSPYQRILDRKIALSSVRDVFSKNTGRSILGRTHGRCLDTTDQVNQFATSFYQGVKVVAEGAVSYYIDHLVSSCVAPSPDSRLE